MNQKTLERVVVAGTAGKVYVETRALGGGFSPEQARALARRLLDAAVEAERAATREALASVRLRAPSLEALTQTMQQQQQRRPGRTS